jgi:hypothetical protein
VATVQIHNLTASTFTTKTSFHRVLGYVLGRDTVRQGVATFFFRGAKNIFPFGLKGQETPPDLF